jgi:muramidase (phage lysozyme)
MTEKLKAFIRRTETGKENELVQYETIIGHNQDKLAVPLTKMTVDEIIASSDRWRKLFGTTSGAAGAYQIIKPTLVMLKKDLHLSGNEKFTPDLQDRMCDKLLAKRGLAAFLRGDISPTEFGNNLAREWASFPLLSPGKRGNVSLQRGQSYYDKFAGNSALVTAEKVETVLDAIRTPAPATGGKNQEKPTIPAVPVGEPAEGQPQRTPLNWIVGALVLALVIAIVYFVFFYRG